MYFQKSGENYFFILFFATYLKSIEAQNILEKTTKSMLNNFEITLESFMKKKFFLHLNIHKSMHILTECKYSSYINFMVKPIFSKSDVKEAKCAYLIKESITEKTF